MSGLFRVLAVVFAAFCARAERAADVLSLDGAWEMAYSPFDRDSQELPRFRGVTVERAVPGYWEDMVRDFRAAGLTNDFRINPQYVRQKLPIVGSAHDTTLPDIRGTFFYRRTVDLSRTTDAVLAFEGVRNSVHVWVNGLFAGAHRGYSTPFEIRVSADLLKTGRNEIVLSVCNAPVPGYCDVVSGLTSRGLFAATGGVNGHLELRFADRVSPKVHVLTAKDLRSFTVCVTDEKTYAYRILDAGRVIAEGAASGDVTLPTEGCSLWSPESPRLYDLEVSARGNVTRQKFGLRRLTAEGERLFLNGRPVYLRGVTEHCYFPANVHVPRDLDYYRMVTRKRKELGFNFVRFHTFVPPVEYLQATDELGMLVHVESPNFTSEPEFAEIVAFARTHPSVVIYCTGNETRIDRLAETYLEDVADIVRRETDALFSPMSALRGMEYMLVPGKDAVRTDPFPHNPERLSRVARFSDLFTSYQHGAVSYGSLNFATSDDLDAWGDVYCGKPRLSHEICIDGSYMDLSLERLYPVGSPVVKTELFSGVRGHLAQKGLLDRADAYFRNSCEWMRRIRKFTFEKIRRSKRTAGYDFLGDIDTHWHTFGYSVGLMDEFYRLKPGETVENVLRYNSAAVLLCDLGSDFNVEAGTTRGVRFAISNYADVAPSPRLEARLVDAETGETVSVASDAWPDRTLANGEVVSLGGLTVRIPEATTPRKYLLRASFAGGKVRATNEWELYAFPRVGEPSAPDVRVACRLSERELLDAMARGERVLLLGTGPFRSLPTSFRIGMAGRCQGNFATVIKAGHPALRGFPHDGFCGWQFRRLMEGGAAVQLEADVPFDPIIDVASSEKCAIRQAALFEYAVGKGCLLVCSFRFGEDDPAARWLKARLVAYAGSEDFRPRHTLTEQALRALVRAPLVSGAADGNRARNPNDPASAVRAGALAQP